MTTMSNYDYIGAPGLALPVSAQEFKNLLDYEEGGVSGLVYVHGSPSVQEDKGIHIFIDREAFLEKGSVSVTNIYLKK